MEELISKAALIAMCGVAIWSTANIVFAAYFRQKRLFIRNMAAETAKTRGTYG